MENKIITINSQHGNFEFTRADNSVDILCRSLNDNEWDIIDMMGLDKDYVEIVEQAIKQLNQ
jgi:hypothetical protein|tara:strand:+ start:58 stop:243 length:186 start_codon:yes stop_codon:yes gene_type:complete